MSISSFFRKLKYGAYENSPRYRLYEELADIFRVPAQHIYEIAHGKKPMNPIDMDIMNELMARGVIVNK